MVKYFFDKIYYHDKESFRLCNDDDCNNDKTNPVCKEGYKKEFNRYRYGCFLDCGRIAKVDFGGNITEAYTVICQINNSEFTHKNEYKHNFVDKIDELQHFYIIKDDNKVGEGIIYLPTKIVGVHYMFPNRIDKNDWVKLICGTLEKKKFLEFLEKYNLEIIYDELQIKIYKNKFENNNTIKIQKYEKLRKERRELKNKIRELIDEIYNSQYRYETETDSGSDDD